MISNVLLINQKGEVVISRIYREGASQKTIDTFRNQVCGVSCASGGADARSRARRPGDLCTGGAWVARGGQGMCPARPLRSRRTARTLVRAAGRVCVKHSVREHRAY